MLDTTKSDEIFKQVVKFVEESKTHTRKLGWVVRFQDLDKLSQGDLEDLLHQLVVDLGLVLNQDDGLSPDTADNTVGFFHF